MSLVLIHTVLSARSQTSSSVKINENYKYNGISKERKKVFTCMPSGLLSLIAFLTHFLCAYTVRSSNFWYLWLSCIFLVPGCLMTFSSLSSVICLISLSACFLTLLKAKKNVQLSQVGLLLHITVGALEMHVTWNFFLIDLPLFPRGTTFSLPLPPKGFLPASALSLFKPAISVTYHSAENRCQWWALL